MSTNGSFFIDNIKEINNYIQLIIWVSLVIPVYFIIGTAIKVFNLHYSHCFLMFFAILSLAFIYTLLNKKTKKYVFTSSFGMLAINIIISIFGFNSRIVLTISMAFGPIISCLYYDRKVTWISLLIGFMTVSLSLFIKSWTIVEILNFKGRVTPMSWFIPTELGVACEYLILCVIVHVLTYKTHKLLEQLVNADEERAIILKKLREKNKFIEKVNENLEQNLKKLNFTQLSIVEFVAQVLGSHDLFTGRHVIHTQKYVEIICKQLRAKGFYIDELTDENIELYRSAAFLHDIGKVHVPEGILNKPGRFTPEEFELMKSHSTEGKKLLEFLPQINDGKFNEIAKKMAYCHHEKWDGTGYPQHLKGKEIPLCARIMAAADVLDALISERLYKDPMSIQDAMKVFREIKGTHLEDCIVDAVIDLEYTIEIIDSDFKVEENSTNSEEKEWWLRYHESVNKAQLQRMSNI